MDSNGVRPHVSGARLNGASRNSEKCRGLTQYGALLPNGEQCDLRRGAVMSPVWAKHLEPGTDPYWVSPLRVAGKKKRPEGRLLR
jgi:hypothetical protein